MWKFVYSGLSLQNGRKANMDSLLLKSKTVGGHAALLAVVCDGVGSCRDGAFASGTAARELGRWFDQCADFRYAGLKMRDATVEINAGIAREMKRSDLQGASTLSAALFVDGQYSIVHLGDSRIYTHDGRALSLLTSDDVSERGGLTAYIGQDQGLVPQYLEGASEGRVFLLCSDGLYKRMDLQVLAAGIKADNTRAAKSSVRALAKAVIQRGERDNITLALIHPVFR